MNLEEARGYLIQALREPGWNQVTMLFASVGSIRERAQGRGPNLGFGRVEFLDKRDRALLLEVVWSFIVQGILVPGLDDGNQGWPFLRLTEYGRQCVQNERILPHDPDGYLREFHRTIPSADAVITEYLTESLQCYIHGLHRASAIMLGGASEQAVLLLIESHGRSIEDLKKRERFESEVRRAPTVFRKYELFDKRVSGLLDHMPKALTENLDSLLRGVFDLIRGSRNDAGHPAGGVSVDRDSVFSHLRLFIPYCHRIYILIEWFSANKT
jgi:hypothetical protein